MISIATNTILREGKSENIKEWRVIFYTPFGWTPDVSEAIKRVTEKGLDPDTVIIPVALAISETMEEVFAK